MFVALTVEFSISFCLQRQIPTWLHLIIYIQFVLILKTATGQFSYRLQQLILL